MAKAGNVEAGLGIAIALIAPVGGTVLTLVTKQWEFIAYGLAVELNGLAMIYRGAKKHTLMEQSRQNNSSK